MLIYHYIRKRSKGCLLEQGWLLGLIWYIHDKENHIFHQTAISTITLLMNMQLCIFLFVSVEFQINHNFWGTDFIHFSLDPILFTFPNSAAQTS